MAATGSLNNLGKFFKEIYKVFIGDWTSRLARFKDKQVEGVCSQNVLKNVLMRFLNNKI
jgi:hypothetical protein